MGTYVKRIAAIRQIKEGFSPSGAPLSGLVKAEKYGGELSVECSLINFAPLSEGKYTCAVTDGRVTEIFDCPDGTRKSDININGGFAAVICFVNGGAQAIASAVSGGMSYELLALKAAAERAEHKENPAPPEQNEADIEYHDEAIAEVNYYELESVKNGGDDCEAQKKETGGNASQKNENDSGVGGEKQKFFQKIEDEVKRLLGEYPKEPALCAAVENSEWVKIDYGEGKYYVFGVIYKDGSAQTLCYGVPADGSEPPKSLQGIAVFIPTESGGYFVSCQNADTGETIKVKL